jgi:hypothetical protein
MNTRILIIAALLLIAGSAGSFAQTKMIAHRSHAGSDETFTAEGSDNFGLGPTRRIDSVLKLSDSVVIEFSNFGDDTVEGRKGWNDPTISLDSLRAKHPRIKFIGFEKDQAALMGQERRSAAGLVAADEPVRGRGARWLLMLGAALVPAVGYSIWRAERGRKT